MGVYYKHTGIQILLEDSEESDNRYDRSVEQMEDYTVSTKQSKEETTGMQAADSTDGKAAVCEGGQGEEACACGHYKIIPRDAAETAAEPDQPHYRPAQRDQEHDRREQILRGYPDPDRGGGERAAESWLYCTAGAHADLCRGRSEEGQRSDHGRGDRTD